MGATRDDFIKYPRTSHLFGSKGTDDEKHLGREESDAFIADPSLIVEEKLDGTNVGIHLCYWVYDEGDRCVASGHAGLFEAVVPPGYGYPPRYYEPSPSGYYGYPRPPAPIGQRYYD